MLLFDLIFKMLPTSYICFLVMTNYYKLPIHNATAFMKYTFYPDSISSINIP